MRITVITGGATAERTVAFAGATQVAAALRGRGHSVHVVDTTAGLLDEVEESRLLQADVGATPPGDLAGLVDAERHFLAERLAAVPVVQGADVLFLVVHGGMGEGGQLQAVLDLSGVPYTGSGALGSALAVDKDLSKRLFRAAGVPVPEWFLAPAQPEDISKTLGWPVIVKPSNGGSTIGLSLVRNAKGLEDAIRMARAYDDEVMIEQFIPGREVTVGVLGEVPLPVGEIVPKHELFDYECKYTPGMSVETFPAQLPPAIAAKLQAAALLAHRALKLRGYSRIDFRLTGSGDIFCLEANNLPGLTGTSLFPQAAKAAGIGYAEMCERICALARDTRVSGKG
jgi:D-alanine-D-alanine ligase